MQPKPTFPQLMLQAKWRSKDTIATLNKGLGSLCVKVNMVLNVQKKKKKKRLIRDWEKGGRGYGGEGRGSSYTYRCTVTTRMTPALRWAAMRAILMFH